MLDVRAASSIFAAANGRTIVLVGDLMLDEWIIGTTTRISPEAPVPVVRLRERRTAPGAGANVAMNLLKMGARVRVVGVVGNDWAGEELGRELEEAGADVSGLLRDDTRPTILKTRIVAQSQQQHQQMVRVDRESEAPFQRSVIEALRGHLHTSLAGATALCISDYDKGLATSGVLGSTIQEALKLGLRVAGGPKPPNLAYFRGADFVSLNQYEASEAAGVRLDSEDVVESAGEALRQQLEVRSLVITFSSRGARLFEEGKPSHFLRNHEVEVFDGTGAGDTFLAGTTIGLAGGANFGQASELGNLAGAASVRHTGVVAVTPEEVLRVAEEPLPSTQ
jgi:D-beta-D-heptose 7-phosphate kinase/D-beta-D-heptose 1-phosphate adenosyltransferase